MKSALRWISLLALPVVVVAILTSSTGPETSFSVPKLVADLVDPYLAGAAVLGAIVASRLPAHREAKATPRARALLVAGRVLVWGGLLAAVTVLASVYVTLPGPAVVDAQTMRRLALHGAFFAVGLGSLVLVPRAYALGAKPKGVTRFIDIVAPLGFGDCAMVVLLSLFCYRAALIGEPGSAVYFEWPTFDTVSAGFVLWSVGVTSVLTTLAVLAAGDRGRPLVDRLVEVIPAAATLTAAMVVLLGLNTIASSGGQANPVEVKALAGRALVVYSTGALVALVLWWRRPSAVPATA